MYLYDLAFVILVWVDDHVALLFENCMQGSCTFFFWCFEFSCPRDTDDAQYNLDGITNVDGWCITV